MRCLFHECVQLRNVYASRIVFDARAQLVDVAEVEPKDELINMLGQSILSGYGGLDALGNEHCSI